jgi:prepilin-type N-terminal cleavage/methylation domain-containing protein
MQHSHLRRTGFSLTELIVVMCVLLALLAAGFAVMSSMRGRTAISATQTLVGSLATQIVTYSTKQWSWQEPSGTKTGQLFDLNRDGLIDGAPGVTATPELDGGFSAELIASGYRGYVAMSGATMKKSLIAKNQQPLDAWQRPLRIAFAGKIYGTAGFGIWSAGADGIDGTSDDISSWQSTP